MLGEIGAAKSARIASRLEKEIKSGMISRGERLDSENSLMRRFSVSRTTIRKSLAILSREGLITKRNGLGSFVTYSGRIIDNDGGWTLALAEGPIEIGTRLLTLKRGSVGEDDGPIPSGADCLFVDRLRFRIDDGLGISLERSQVPWREGLADMLTTGLIDGSLNKTLVATGLTVASGEEWASVVASLGAEDAAIMGRVDGEPMLRLRRVTRTEDGRVIEHVDSILDPGHFGLHVAF
ncbi:MAG: GntR family transcriptional regulator [Geminicoccaceae bacterium]